MTKFIVEYRNNKYTMSFIDDYKPTSTGEHDSLNDSVSEMHSLFDNRMNDNSEDMYESMDKIRSLYECNKLPIEFMGVNLLNSDKIKSDILKEFNTIAVSYCNNK